MFYELESDLSLATPAQADAEYALNVGAQRQQEAWILSDRDVWYRNPSYKGPPVPHPEDDIDLSMCDKEIAFWENFVGPFQRFEDHVAVGMDDEIDLHALVCFVAD